VWFGCSVSATGSLRARSQTFPPKRQALKVPGLPMGMCDVFPIVRGSIILCEFGVQLDAQDDGAPSAYGFFRIRGAWCFDRQCPDARAWPATRSSRIRGGVLRSLAG